VNRIDKIIVFRPLSRDLMRMIVLKELNGLLERRGLRRREWAVEWEASSIEFLLDRGFSQEMGARPLKRAIDQHVLAPLAATLVEHRFPEGGQFLFVRSNGRAIEVEFVDPDAEEMRQQHPNATFGGGIHICPGRNVARVIIDSVLRGLMSPGVAIELTGPVEWIPRSTMRQPIRMPVVISRS
jgi:hypothetical protein